MENGAKRCGDLPRPGAAWLAWAFTGALIGYAVVLHHGLGPPPEAGAQRWYEPTAFLHRLGFLGFAFDSTASALLCFALPALLLAAGVFATGRSAAARTLALGCVLAAVLFSFYGAFAARVWQFFGWRGSAVLWVTAACLGGAAGAPFLAASWLRLGWPLRIAVYLPVAFGITAFLRNATGTNPALAYSISPWPAVPLFGLEVGAAFVLAVLSGVAIATAGFAASDARRGAAALGIRLIAVALGLSAPPGLLALWARLGLLPFRLGSEALLGVAVLCAAAIPGVAALGLAGDRSALRRRARQLAVGVALAGLPLLAGVSLARLDGYVTRERRARELIEALDRYVQRESLYPDALEDLVAAGDIEAIPEPAIGFGFLRDSGFVYQGFGTSYLLEFAAPRWVQCTYTPPYADAGDEGEEPRGEDWLCPSQTPQLW